MKKMGRLALGVLILTVLSGCRPGEGRGPDVEIRGGDAAEAPAMPVTADTQVVELPEEAPEAVPGR